MLELPAPLVPPEVDLRDFPFMPLEVRRLLTSETWIDACDVPKVGHAAMSLWAESWHQLPAASLPDNDKVLARLAMCDSRTWKRIRESVLAGWVKCSDGLLYHPVVAEKARESWQFKLKQRARTEAATAAREAKRQAEKEAAESLRRKQDAKSPQRDVERESERSDQRDEERDEERNGVQETGPDRTGSKSKSFTPARTPRTADDPPPEPTAAGRACLLMRQAGCVATNPSHAELVEALALGVTPETLGHTAAEAIELGKSKPFAWAISTAIARHHDSANKRNGSTHHATRNHADDGSEPPSREGLADRNARKFDAIMARTYGEDAGGVVDRGDERMGPEMDEPAR